MDTPPTSSYLKHYSRGKDDFGFFLALSVSLILHFGLIGIAYWASKGPKRHPLPTAITVSLASSLPSSRGGKQTKAPVIRATPKKAVAKKKKKDVPKPKKKTPKKDNRVGLKTRETTKKKYEPEKQETADSGVERNRPTGGAGGAEDNGIAFELGHRGAQDLNLQEAKFQGYYRTILDEVDRRWAKGNLTGGTATISFKVAKDGAVSRVEVSVSSGLAYLDGPAERAVLGARLPPLPQGFGEEELIVTINFRYGPQ